MTILCVGLNHESAPLPVLEAANLPQDRMASFLREFRTSDEVQEIAGLSTCNRTEFYLVAEESRRVREELLGRFQEQSQSGELKDFSYTHRNDQAARHLFRVAAGIDSLIVGESQILGQLRHAYELAMESGCIGGMLNSLMVRAISFGRRVRTLTEIGKGNVSVASVAVKAAQEVFPDLCGKRLLVIGAGETARLASEHFRKQGLGDIAVTNRTEERAGIMARSLGGRVVPLDRMQSAVEESDIVLCAAGAPHYILTRSGLKPMLAQRRGRPMVLIDLSMPRNIDPLCGDLEGVRLTSLEDLEAIADENRGQRVSEITQVESMIDRETVNFMRWTQTTESSRLIAMLRRRAEETRREHMRRHGKHLSPEARDEVSKFSDSLMRSVLHDLTLSIRGLDTETEEGRRQFEMACRLFNIDPNDLFD